MPDILQTSLSGLIAFQRALATTSNNIANASTDGYSRQRVELVARQPELLGSGFIGRGVDLESVRRIVDLLAVSQLRGSSSDLGRLETYSALAGRVVNALGDSTSGLPAQLSAFFAAWQDVATNPTSTAARQQLLAQAQTLAGTFRTAASTLDRLVADTNAGITARVEQINQLAGSIARLNSDIEAKAATAGGQPPNDLLDQRDALLTQLSKLVNITTVADAGGSVNVFIGTGQTLVLRGFTAGLDAVPSSLDASRLEISYRSDAGAQTITQFVTGGELGGLLQGRSELVDGVQCQLGLVAASLAAAVNDQQNAGMDLFGRLGADMFSVSGPQAIAATGNTGAAALAATIADLGALTGDDYVLRFDGVAWTATRASNGEAVTLAGTGTVADPLRLDGLAVVVGGAASAGDRYTLRGTRDALGSMRALLIDPRSVAAAAPIRASALAANLGSASVTAGEVVDASDPSLMATVDIRFITPTTYSINGAGSYAYTSGADIVVNGWRVRISGTPATGDTFRVERNASGAGDNRNALLAAGLQMKGVLDGGTTSLGDGLIRLVGRTGTLAGQADFGLRAQQVIQSNSMAAVQTASGVNLDEEAADMLRWQQAYQASAQMIKAASTLFDTLLSAVRG